MQNALFANSWALLCFLSNMWMTAYFAVNIQISSPPPPLPLKCAGSIKHVPFTPRSGTSQTPSCDGGKCFISVSVFEKQGCSRCRGRVCVAPQGCVGAEGGSVGGSIHSPWLPHASIKHSNPPTPTPFTHLDCTLKSSSLIRTHLLYRALHKRQLECQSKVQQHL